MLEERERADQDLRGTAIPCSLNTAAWLETLAALEVEFESILHPDATAITHSLGSLDATSAHRAA